MPQSVIQNIEQKLRFHQFYIDQTIFELKRNAVIEKLIKKEVLTIEGISEILSIVNKSTYY